MYDLRDVSNITKLINRHFKVEFELDLVRVTNLLILHKLSLILPVFKFLV